MPPRRVFFLLLLLGAVCVGCARDKRKPVFRVTGRVLYEGKATPGALVVFHPLAEAETFHVRPHAVVDRDGRFEVGMYEPGGGMPPGDYLVTVRWTKPSRHPDLEGPSLLPARYNDPKTSGLKVEIKEGENELLPFELRN